MIAFVKGEYAYKSPSLVIVDVHGVGYELHISLNTYSDIEGQDAGLLFTHYHVREDAHTLFGFSRESEKSLFIHLISVSGVGATTARIMLSSMKPEEIIRAISSGNAKLLETIKGIGRKSAERIILELKDKLSKGTTIQLAGNNNAALINNSLEQDALNALVSLGIARTVAEQAIQRVLSAGPEDRVEDVIKKALKTL